MSRWMIAGLLLWWLTRLAALEALPLHNDEGLHLTRAVEVWNGHPFWAISDGKIINHWVIAALLPQAAPAFAGRLATLLVCAAGLAAGASLARRWGGPPGWALVCGLWIAAPYLFFYERLAFSDAQAGALVVVAVWAAARAARRGRLDDAILTGLALSLAILFKFTAAPFALTVTLLILAGRAPWRRRAAQLALAAGVVAAGLSVPLAYLALRGGEVFAVALGWVGAGDRGADFGANAAHLWAQLSGFGAFAWAALLVAGLALLPRVTRLEGGLSRLSGARALLAWGLPVALILLLGREVQSRHFVVALPLALTLAGVGLGRGIRRFRRAAVQRLTMTAGLGALLVGGLPFMLTAYADPARLPLPDDVRYEHVTSHSAGYGLRAAVADLPALTAARPAPIVGSMFPDSCRRANFYAAAAARLICADAPGLLAIEAALDEAGAVYVLSDSAPHIGVSGEALATLGRTTRLAQYMRPGETEAAASVSLWLVEQP